MGYSASGSVRYFDGSVHITATDLASAGFGIPFGQTRTWDSQAVYNLSTYGTPQGGMNGSGWSDVQMPWLLQDGNTIISMTGSSAKRSSILTTRTQTQVILSTRRDSSSRTLWWTTSVTSSLS